MFSGTSVASHPPEYELLESFGPDGTGTTNFERAASSAFDQTSDVLYVLDDELGILYKFDSDGDPVDWGGSAPYIDGHKITGLSFPPFSEWEHQVAVDSISHKIFVTDANSLSAFLPDGEPAEFTAGPGAGTSTIGGFSRIGGIATDVAGYIYASDTEAGIVKVFKPSGEKINEFTAGSAANLAVDQAGAVYVNRSGGNVLKFDASTPPPVTEATTYSAASEPVDPAGSLSVAIDPVTNNVYIAKSGLSPGILVYDDEGELITSFGQEGSEGALGISRGVAVDGDSTRVYVGNRNGPDDSQVEVFKPKPPPPPAAPTIEDLVVRKVGDTSATLAARINPNSLATTYHFEYGLEDCSTSACASVPAVPASIGSDHEPVAVSHGIGNLLRASTYYYRVIAENSLGVTTKTGTFRSQGSGLGFQLIDRRAWEMVSPSDKHGALIIPGLDRGHIQAAADGTGLAYLTIGSIEEAPAGNRAEPRTAVAQRDGEGRWSSRDFMSPNSRVVPPSLGQQSEFKLFNADLSEALLEPRDGTDLSLEASERTPYWRQSSVPPVYRPLVTGKEGFANVPSDIEFGGGKSAVSAVAIQAATPDFNHVVLSSGVGLAHGDPPKATYMWSEGHIEPVSVLPDAEGGEIISSSPGSADRSMRHAISDDGTRVFWTSGFPQQWSTPGSSWHLYARDMVAGESARLDLPSDGSGAGASEPVFQGASADGSVAFFTDSAQLTADASPSGADLYRCELPLATPLAGCATLTNISAPIPGSGESTEVLGVIAALSEDGTRAYFVAKGKLDSEPNQAGHVAVSGEPNLYIWQEGEGVRFIATLSDEDKADWGLNPSEGPRVGLLSAASSPGGRYLAFMSERSLSGESHLNVAWEPVERVFRYDAQADRFDCISCDPTGGAPEGTMVSDDDRSFVDPWSQWPGRLVSAVVPQSPMIGTADTMIPLYRTRSVHDNGRVYFNASDPLVPADSNGEWDVYQYEPSETGTCDSAVTGAATSALAGGCVSLISSGTAAGPAGFFDAGVGGDDVFFITQAPLSVLDQDAENDIYDARVDGIKATLVPPAECLGESCQAPPVVPSDPTPGSSTFQGSGNLKPKAAKRCPKGKRKARRRGQVRCVPRKSHKSQSHKPRAGQDGRAAR